VMVALFAAASPGAALLTYAGALWALQSTANPNDISPAEAQNQAEGVSHAAQPWLGLIFLFAGGTFLHVAVTHGLPSHSHSEGADAVHARHLDGARAELGTSSEQQTADPRRTEESAPFLGAAASNGARAGTPDSAMSLTGEQSPVTQLQSSRSALPMKAPQSSLGERHMPACAVSSSMATAAVAQRDTVRQARGGDCMGAVRLSCCAPQAAIPIFLGMLLPVLMSLGAAPHHH
jgi:hypothetical protein